MCKTNIEISSDQINELKKFTGERSGYNAVQKALMYYLKQAQSKRILDVLEEIQFNKNFNPLKLRKSEK